MSITPIGGGLGGSRQDRSSRESTGGRSGHKITTASLREQKLRREPIPPLPDHLKQVIEEMK